MLRYLLRGTVGTEIVLNHYQTPEYRNIATLIDSDLRAVNYKLAQKPVNDLLLLLTTNSIPDDGVQCSALIIRIKKRACKA